MTVRLNDQQKFLMLFSQVRFAKRQLREEARPLVVKALGDWAADDDTAHANGHSWNVAPIYQRGLCVALDVLEVCYGFGHNEPTTNRHHRIDLSQEF